MQAASGHIYIVKGMQLYSGIPVSFKINNHIYVPKVKHILCHADYDVQLSQLYGLATIGRPYLFFSLFHEQNIYGVMLPYEALFSDNNGIEFGVTCAGNCKKYRTGNFRRVRRGKIMFP